MKLKNPPVRVHNQRLSLWQSAVKESALKLFSDNPEFVQKLIDASDAFVKPAAEDPGYPLTSPQVFASAYPSGSTTPFTQLSSENLSALLERQFLDQFLIDKNATVLATTSTSTTYRPFSDDPWYVWVEECGDAYQAAFRAHNGTRAYNSYPKSQISSFGVIDWQIPQGSKVAIIGDWGTGEEDAKYLFKDMIQQHSPAAIIHLGDVYYAGTTSETSGNFTDIISAVFSELHVNIPVFTIPGNHEYYSLGYPYFAALPGLNSSLGSDHLQEASYFCLRVADSQWQFLAMDTGYNDSDPSDEFDPFSEGPHIRSDERKWHKDKMDNFSGTTILLSHHQLFSANAKINGVSSWDGIWHSEYLNMGLLDTFQPYFKDKVACWIWGHEHNFAAYQNNLEGLAKGRLLGCSAYEEETSSDPYTVNCTDYPYYVDDNHRSGYKVTNSNGYYNHAYCILDFSNCSSANDSVDANYYEYPSWGGSTPRPSNPASTPLFTESISRPVALQQPKVNYNDVIKLGCVKNNTHMFIAGADAAYNAKLENYIENFQILPASTSESGDVDDSDTVYLVNISPVLNGYKYLSTNGTTGELRYLQSPTSESVWQIKIDGGTSGTSIHRGDSIHFKSNAHSSYFLNINSNNMLVLNSSSYLSLNINTGASVPTANPFPSGQAVRLAVAYENEWYYLGESFYYNSMNYVGVISMHDYMANSERGVSSVQLQNVTDNGTTTYTVAGIQFTIARLLTAGDNVNFETIVSSGMGVAGSSYLKSGSNTLPVYIQNSQNPTGDFMIVKADGSTGGILQNELLHIKSNYNSNHYYLNVITVDGKLCLGFSSTPALCRLDYQEVYKAS